MAPHLVYNEHHPKSINGLAPEYLTRKFIQRSDVNPYIPRDCENKLAIPLSRTNYLKNSFSYSGATLWNSLPSEARQASSLKIFRRNLSNLDMAFMETRFSFIVSVRVWGWGLVLFKSSCLLLRELILSVYFTKSYILIYFLHNCVLPDVFTVYK